MRPLPLFLAVFLGTTLLRAAEPVTLTLEDFTDDKGAKPAAGWAVESDGSIHRVAKAGNIISKKEYSSFEVEWDWKLAEGGNSGIKYWVNKFEKGGWLGIEYQMIDDSRHADANKGGGTHSTASFYDIKAPAADKAVKPAGEWNHSKVIVAKDGKIQHWLNGKLATEIDSKSEEWTAGIGKSKFKAVTGFAPGKGKLMLTDHGDEVWWKNIKVTEL
ncbi:MAG: DUF1080 domain-containing protein [Verrucomicrobium sp.]